MITKKLLDVLTFQVIGAAIEVHKELGPGLLESIYEKCFRKELLSRNIKCKTQIYVPIIYKGEELYTELRLDVLVEDILVVELKAVEGLIPLFDAQLLTYMKLLQKPKGLLFNFNCVNISKEGLRSMVNELYAELPEI